MLLLDKVDKEGAGAMISYVHPKPPLMFRRPSSSLVFSGGLANHRPSQRAQVQPVNFETLYPQQSLRSLHRRTLNPHSLNHPRVVADLFSLTRPNLPDDPVMPYNSFATVEGEMAFFHLLRKENADAN